MPEHNNVYEAPKIMGFLDKDGNRVILTDLTEIGNCILNGGTLCHRISTMEGASIWKNHGEIKHCDLNMENEIMGFLDKDENRVILTDCIEIANCMLNGGTLCHRFSTMEGASIWQNHGEIKHCDLNMENTKQQKGREDHSLEQAAEPSAKETDFNATTVCFGLTSDDIRMTKQQKGREDHSLEQAAEPSAKETDFNATTISCGLTSDDIRMIVCDFHELEHHLQRGATLHYSFPTMEEASFWEKHGIVRDHFFEAYSVDQNTVGLHEVLTEGAEKTNNNHYHNTKI